MHLKRRVVNKPPNSSETDKKQFVVVVKSFTISMCKSVIITTQNSSERWQLHEQHPSAVPNVMGGGILIVAV